MTWYPQQNADLHNGRRVISNAHPVEVPVNGGGWGGAGEISAGEISLEVLEVPLNRFVTGDLLPTQLALLHLAVNDDQKEEKHIRRRLGNEFDARRRHHSPDLQRFTNTLPLSRVHKPEWKSGVHSLYTLPFPMVTSEIVEGLNLEV